VNYYLICPVGVIAGTQDELTYSSQAELLPGEIVKIPFGTRSKIGVVTTETTVPGFKTKAIQESLSIYLPEHLLEVAKWMSAYYATRLPFVFQTLLPSGITKKRRALKPRDDSTVDRKLSSQTLTADQKKTITAIETSTQITHLIHGITGSGKTRVYQELARDVLRQQNSVIVLVPEIALTPQLASEFLQLHKNVLIMHSNLTESERHQNWLMLLGSKEPWVVVGPRSTLFAPLTNIGLIVIDEAHEPSYQQDSQPKYNALRVARKLADSTKLSTKVLLGSATPLVSDYYIAQATNSPIHPLSLPTKTRHTSIEIVDIKDRQAFGTHSLFSRKLLEAMNTAVAQNEQILLFHNRRGTARMSLCSNCGWSAECPACHIPLRLHQDTSRLQCHTCGYTSPLPKVCPDCGGVDIDFKGFGSKRIESEARKLYPNLEIARFDSDTEATQQLQHRYQDLYDNKINIIIGTQGIAKGLDLPHLSTVGIIQADSELFIPDYSSSERAFQLTTQVIGRAGRMGQDSSVVIQTLNPDHPAITSAAKQDYSMFYNGEIEERLAERMPPHVFLLQITGGYASSTAAKSAAIKLSETIKKLYPGIFVRGPAPAFHEHRGTQYYQQLIVSSNDRSKLVAIARSLPSRWHFTLDPINLL